MRRSKSLLVFVIFAMWSNPYDDAPWLIQRAVDVGVTVFAVVFSATLLIAWLNDYDPHEGIDT